MGCVSHTVSSARGEKEHLKPFSSSYDIQVPSKCGLNRGLVWNTLGDTDMDDHRSCGFLLSAIPFILIPPLKKKTIGC
jgi:hypothetical protein